MKELQDFDLESKVRRIVSQLLEPTIQRGTENKEHIMILNNLYDSINRRIQDIEQVAANATDKMKIIESIRADHTDLEVHTALQIDSLQKKDENLMGRINSLDMVQQQRFKELENLQRNQYQIQREMKRMDDDMIKVKGVAMKATENLNASNTEIYGKIEEKGAESESELKTIREILNQLNAEQGRVKVEVINIKEYTDNYGVIFNEIKELKCDKEYIQTIEESFSKRQLLARNDYNILHEKLHSTIHDFEDKCRIIDSLSFYTYTHISTIFYEVFDPMFKRKFAEYEQGKVEQLIKEIKDHRFMVEIKKIGDRAQLVLDTVFPVANRRQSKLPIGSSMIPEKPGEVRRLALNLAQHFKTSMGDKPAEIDYKLQSGTVTELSESITSSLTPRVPKEPQEPRPPGQQRAAPARNKYQGDISSDSNESYVDLQDQVDRLKDKLKSKFQTI